MTKMEQYAHGQFAWVDLMAHDMGEAKEWYCKLFGWDVRQEDTDGGPPYAQFVLRGAPVAGLGEMSPDMKERGVPPMWNSYVNVDSAEAAEARVKELGGQVMVPTMKVADAGWLAFFVDPEGAPFAVWQAGTHQGAGIVNEPGALSWNELATRKAGAAKQFYGELFGWEFSDMPAGETTYSVIKNAGRDNGGFIEMNEKWGDLPPHWMVYFAVEDTDATCASVKETGGNVHVEPTDIPVGRFAVLSDPQGAPFTVIKLAG